MIEEIDIYIKDRFTPEVCDVVSRLFAVLESLTEDDFQIQYMNIVMSDESAEEGNSEERFTNLLMDNMEYILKQHSIVLADDILMGDQIELIEGVLALADYDNRQAMLDQIDASDDTVEAFAAVISMVTTLDESKVFTMVDQVDPAFMGRLRTHLLADSILEDNTATLENNMIVVVLKKLRTYLQYPQAKGFELINANLPIGAKFEHYMPHFSEVFKIKEVETLAKELAVLLYMSGDSHKSPLVFYKSISNYLFEDMQMMTKMEIALTNLLAGFESTFNPRNQKESDNAQA